ncbi:IS21 family transposase [Georgenia daeguensis]|uniref:IS21 family transposase n=1 Tax=Georgenia daeguensis TaxID=908355 RepID=A0ABP6US85_9MICO
MRALLAEHPKMPATVLAERVSWSGSVTWFRENVARLRPRYLPVDPADRLAHAPGEQVQCDLWFPPVKVPVGPGQAASLPVLVMAAAHSRFLAAMMLPSRTTADLLAGMWHLLSSQLGAVPRALLWDNEAGIGRSGRLAQGVAGFCGTLATRLVQARPYDPETKGIVERANGYLETSFLPGRTFASPADFNTQLQEWLPRANARTVRALGARPVDLVAADRAAMLPLPPLAPDVGARWVTRLGRDYYVRAGANDYSVDPAVIGRLVEVSLDLDRVEVTCEGQVVADHARSWTRGLTVTDPGHVATAKVLRQRFLTPGPAPDVEADLARDLSVYDVAFGVTGLDGQVA